MRFLGSFCVTRAYLRGYSTRIFISGSSARARLWSRGLLCTKCLENHRIRDCEISCCLWVFQRTHYTAVAFDKSFLYSKNVGNLTCLIQAGNKLIGKGSFWNLSLGNGWVDNGSSSELFDFMHNKSFALLYSVTCCLADFLQSIC